MDIPRRRGIILPLALVILMVLGIMAFAVFVLRQHTYRAIGHLDGFLEAVSVGEAGFTSVVARIESQPWSARWFKGGSRSGDGTWRQGSYEYLVSDGAKADEAHLIVWATAGDSRVSMYWRLQATPWSLSPYRRIRVTYFTYLEPDINPTPASLSGIVAQVDTAIVKREQDRPWVEGVQGTLVGATSPGEVPGALGLPDPGAGIRRIPAGTPSASPDPVAPRLDPATSIPAPGAPTLPPVGTANQPATPGAMQSLAIKRDDLDDALRGAKKAQGVLNDTFFGTLPAIEAELAACCNDPSNPGQVACCACLAGSQAYAGQAQSLRTEIEDCISELERVAAQIDQATAPPGPDQGTATRLSADADAAIPCTDQLCKKVGDVIVGVSVSTEPCGRSLGRKGNPGEATRCGLVF